MTPSQTLSALSLAVTLACASAPAASATFVNEATRVVDDIARQSEQTNGALSDFYRDFGEPAAQMVKLEALVERLRREGTLCEHYADCPDKTDLVYAHYGQAMARIQQVFARHREKILAALAGFNQQVYRGRDRIEDLRSNELDNAPAEVRALKGEQAQLRQRQAEITRDCPDSERSTACLRQWREFQRNANRLNRRIQRAAYAHQLGRLRNSVIERLGVVLDGNTHLEADVVAALADYAFVFESYAELSSADGIGQLMGTVQQLADLTQKLDELEQFGEGLKVHVLDVGQLLNERLAQVSGMDLEVQSRRSALANNRELLDSGDRLLEQLEKEVGIQ